MSEVICTSFLVTFPMQFEADSSSEFQMCSNYKRKTVKTNDKILRFGVVMTPLSRSDKNNIMQITYSI